MTRRIVSLLLAAAIAVMLAPSFARAEWIMYVYTDDGKTLKYCPVEETEEYRKRVAQNKNIFEKLYEDIDNGVISSDTADEETKKYLK